MPNTYVNKVITGAGNTLIDLSQDTVTSASHIIGGRVGHLADGSSVSGTGSKTVTYSLSNGVFTNVSPDSIITGEGLCLRLLAPSGYVLSNISVTMGGVDITNSVFAFDTKEEPTLITKSITSSGTYNASDDSADGYSSVTVNVSGGGGGTPAISVVDTVGSHGGTVREITALDISDTTAVASDVASGKYFYTAGGVKTAGTASGGGGGTSAQTQNGTFTGDNGITAQISCDFAPDLIYIYGDLSGDVSLKGIISITIIKDLEIVHTADTSTSNTSENIVYMNTNNVSGYGNSEYPHATYSNGVLTIDTVSNTSANRFTSGITYSYKLVKWTA